MPASTPRTRLIFQNANLYTGPASTSGNTATGHMALFGGVQSNSGSSLLAELSSIQSANLSIDIPQQDVNVFGQLNRYGTVKLSPPSIGLNFTYLATDGYNETMLGFNARGASFLSGILTKASDSKNYFLSVSQQGVDDDAETDPNKRDIWAVGNGYISNYTFDASVGQLPMVSVSVDGMNLVTYTGSSGLQSPAINPENSTRISTWNFWLPRGQVLSGAGNVIALRPGDIQLSFPTNAGFLVPLSGQNSVNVQSFSMSVPIGRGTLDKIGSAFGYSRDITFPVNCTMQIRALATEVQTGSYDALYCGAGINYDLKVRLMKPGCPGTATEEAIVLGFNNAQIKNLSINNSIGGNSTVDVNLTSQIAGSLSTAGITISGFYN